MGFTKDVNMAEVEAVVKVGKCFHPCKLEKTFHIRDGETWFDIILDEMPWGGPIRVRREDLFFKTFTIRDERGKKD